jgi:hypothetical protein
VTHQWRRRMRRLQTQVERSDTGEKARLVCSSQMLVQVLGSTEPSVYRSSSAHEEVRWEELDVGLWAVCMCGSSWRCPGNVAGREVHLIFCRSWWLRYVLKYILGIGHRSGQSSNGWCWSSIGVVTDKVRCVGILDVVLETLTWW